MNKMIGNVRPSTLPTLRPQVNQRPGLETGRHQWTPVSSVSYPTTSKGNENDTSPIKSLGQAIGAAADKGGENEAVKGLIAQLLVNFGQPGGQQPGEGQNPQAVNDRSNSNGNGNSSGNSSSTYQPNANSDVQNSNDVSPNRGTNNSNANDRSNTDNNSNADTSNQTSAGNEASSNTDSPAGDIKNRTDFAKALLKKLGCPETDANVKSLEHWEKLEGGHFKNSAKFNPLNTTQKSNGAGNMNSAGVKRYSSWEQGLDATVKTLNNGRYKDILAALKSGKGLDQGNFQGLKTWSGNTYSHL